MNKLDIEIEKIKFQKINDKHVAMIDVILETFKELDKDMAPLLDIILDTIHLLEGKKVKMYMLLKVLEFYGFNNMDILKTRPKYNVIQGKLVKEFFLNKNQMKSIQILMEEMDFFE